MKALTSLITLFVILVSSIELQSQTVYVTKTGEKYHKESCHYLKKSKREISLQDALDLSYQACSVCKPSKSTAKKQNFTSTSNATSKTNTSTKVEPKSQASTQCTGTTKAGNRCKRITKSSNGRCYQH